VSRPTRTQSFAPRLMTRHDLAIYLRRSEGWLRANLARLCAEGFPAPDVIFDRNGLFDRVAVDAWLDRRFNLRRAAEDGQENEAAAAEAQLLMRIEHAEL
jgi:hypothetical protein